MLDFEQAVVSALLAKRVRVGGCFFHLCQAIMRRVKNERTPLVKFRDWDNTEFRRRIKNLSSLAFLKPKDIPAAFDQLKLTFAPDEQESILSFMWKFAHACCLKVLLVSQVARAICAALPKTPTLIPQHRRFQTNSSLATVTAQISFSVKFLRASAR